MARGVARGDISVSGGTTFIQHGFNVSCSQGHLILDHAAVLDGMPGRDLCEGF